MGWYGAALFLRKLCKFKGIEFLMFHDLFHERVFGHWEAFGRQERLLTGARRGVGGGS
jgi:hypothetical protein